MVSGAEGRELCGELMPGREVVVTQSRHCEVSRHHISSLMRLPEHSPDRMTHPSNGKPSFHFVPAAPMREEPVRIHHPEVSYARFYLILSCTALVLILSAWSHLDRLDERLGRRIPPVLEAMTMPSAPPYEPNSSSPASIPPQAGQERDLRSQTTSH